MINNEMLLQFKNAYNNNPVNNTIQHAIQKVGIKEASVNNTVRAKHTFVFSDETKRGEITNQKASGRCWMFAALNTARVSTMEKLNLSTFEFSQNYTLFWDKLERSNYVLESIIDTIDQPLTSRVVWHLLQAPLEDGGQWEMFAGILKKYGSVPKEIMPETYHSSNTRDLNVQLNDKIRQYACELRTMHQEGATKAELITKKDQQLTFIYGLLTKTLGEVPEKFSYNYRDKDNHYQVIKDITPQEFFNRYVDIDLDNLVSLINAPTKDKPYMQTYTVKYLGSISEAKPIKYLNVPIEVIKEAAVRSIQDGKPVWFGCDVAQMSEKKWGIMDTDMYSYEDTLGEKLMLTKEQRLDYSVSMLTHAMVLVGVDLDEKGQPLTWKVENSWGEEPGKKGIFSMSDQWFDEYTFQITVPKEYLDKKYQDAYELPVHELEPWDPMGALAFLGNNY